jgi:hypothetical protein
MMSWLRGAPDERSTRGFTVQGAATGGPLPPYPPRREAVSVPSSSPPG